MGRSVDSWQRRGRGCLWVKAGCRLGTLMDVRRVKSGGMSAAQITEAARELLASDRGAGIRKAAQALVVA